MRITIIWSVVACIAATSSPAFAETAEESVVGRLDRVEGDLAAAEGALDAVEEDGLAALRLTAETSLLHLAILADRMATLENGSLSLAVVAADEVLSEADARATVDRLVAATADFAALTDDPLVRELGLEGAWRAGGEEMRGVASGLDARLRRDLALDGWEVASALLQIGGTSQSLLEVLYLVARESLKEAEEDKAWFRARIEALNRVADEVSSYLHELGGSTGSTLRVVGGCRLRC